MRLTESATLALRLPSGHTRGMDVPLLKLGIRRLRGRPAPDVPSGPSADDEHALRLLTEPPDEDALLKSESWGPAIAAAAGGGGKGGLDTAFLSEVLDLQERIAECASSPPALCAALRKSLLDEVAGAVSSRMATLESIFDDRWQHPDPLSGLPPAAAAQPLLRGVRVGEVLPVVRELSYLWKIEHSLRE